MKKITILAAVVALLGSCAQNTEDTINPNAKVERRTIYATFDNEEETKTYVENYKYLRWHAGDEISFFDATTHNSQYAFAGNDGDAEGEFNAVATGEGTAIATTYGVYPYNANTTISTEGVITAELPAIQAYGVNSFGKGANTMVAVGESATDDKLFFKNACGYLVVKLYNESGATVKSVVLEGNNEEKIAGAATITATHIGVPSVAMADTATTSVTIDCGEGVEIGTTAETATEFWFALPEITFEGGITITATDTEGKEYEKTTTKPVAITRNNVQPMKALSCEFEIPETWKIRYIATEKVVPNHTYNTNDFGANIVSNDWNVATSEGVITFDGDVTTIRTLAFYRCTSLVNVTIPNSVTSIGAEAFSLCENLTNITIPDNVISIGRSAFNECSCLKNITIPNSVTSIGDFAFNYCTRLNSITIPDSVVSIGDGAFQNCSEIKNVAIPDGVTEIKGSTFSFCENLESVTIPDSVVFIGDGAFGNCTNLENITIPDGITSIGTHAFASCTSLTDINIPCGVTEIKDGTFSYCTSLENVTIPESVVSIGLMAFLNCSNLASISLPIGTTSIGEYAFMGCANFTSITIPDSVTSIGCAAFGNCTSLVSVYCKATTPPIGDSYLFLENALERKIYVPAASVKAYRTAQYWSEYADAIVPYDF